MITVEIHVTPTYSFEPDESPSSLDQEEVMDFLEGLALPDGYISATVTDEETGDYLVVTPDV